MLNNIYFYKAVSQIAYKVIIPHQIPEGEMCIEVITRGKVKFENGWYGPGTVFWHIPGEYTVQETDWNDPYECLSIWLFQDNPRPFNRITRTTDPLETEKFVTSVLQAFHDNRYDKTYLGNYIYNYLVWECHKNEVSASFQDAPRQFGKLIDAMNATPEKKFDLPLMAKLSGISVQHIYRIFKELLDTTPHKYLLNRRIQKAKNLLSITERPIKDISDSCGFDNVETFFRAFKKSESLTPGEYRKKFTIKS